MTIIVKPPQYDYYGLSISRYMIISKYCPSLATVFFAVLWLCGAKAYSSSWPGIVEVTNNCTSLYLLQCSRVADGQTPRCLLSRLDVLPCPLRPRLAMAGPKWEIIASAILCGYLQASSIPTNTVISVNISSIFYLNNYHSQYAIYRTRIRPGNSGFLECRLRGRGIIIR